jgi:hypothetical protein
MRIMFLLAMGLSLVIHHLVFLVFSSPLKGNTASLSQETSISPPAVVAMRIDIPKEKQKEAPPSVPRPPTIPEKKKPAQIVEKKAAKRPSGNALEALGRSALEQAKRGQFPPLTIRYDDPEKYLLEMAKLGARPAIFHEPTGRMWEVLLPDWRIRPFTQADLDKYSPIKRVIRDAVFDQHHASMANELGLSLEDTSLVVLIPLNIETQWMGQQVMAFQSQKVKAEDVIRVNGEFEAGRLRITSILLADGAEKYVD